MLTNKYLLFFQKLNRQLKSRKGFSLIELMVVVAIIAILSTIAIPAYQNFQTKARQKEAPSLLSAYFIAAQAAKVEHGGYAGNFVAIGFNPAGTLNYRITSADTTIDPETGPNDNDCADTSQPQTNCEGMTIAWTEKGGTIGCGASANANATLGVCQAETAVVVNTSTFRVFASGIVNVNADHPTDEWGVNERKKIANTKDGASTSSPNHGTL